MRAGIPGIPGQVSFYWVCLWKYSVYPHIISKLLFFCPFSPSKQLSVKKKEKGNYTKNVFTFCCSYIEHARMCQHRCWEIFSTLFQPLSLSISSFFVFFCTFSFLISLFFSRWGLFSQDEASRTNINSSLADCVEDTVPFWLVISHFWVWIWLTLNPLVGSGVV